MLERNKFLLEGAIHGKAFPNVVNQILGIETANGVKISSLEGIGNSHIFVHFDQTFCGLYVRNLKG